MTTLKFLTAVAIIALIFIIALFRKEKQAYCAKSDEELLQMPQESLEMWSKSQLKHLLEYCHEMKKSACNKKQADRWEQLGRRVWTALYGHQI